MHKPIKKGGNIMNCMTSNSLYNYSCHGSFRKQLCNKKKKLDVLGPHLECPKIKSDVMTELALIEFYF